MSPSPGNTNVRVPNPLHHVYPRPKYLPAKGSPGGKHPDRTGIEQTGPGEQGSPVSRA